MDALQRLRSLCVADVMARKVLTVSAHLTMESAAEVLYRHQLGAAPVVDEQERCVGILSATDFLKREGRLSTEHEPLRDVAAHELRKDADSERPLEIGTSLDDLVCHHMSSAVQTIDPGTELLQAARVMNAQHVHRLLVLDAKGRIRATNVRGGAIERIVSELLDEMKAKPGVRESD